SQIEFHDPSRLFRFLIDDGDRFSNHRPGYDILAIRCDIRVVPRALNRNALDSLQRDCVDDVNSTLSLANGDVYSPAIAADGDIVGMATERNLASHPKSPRVDHVQCAIGFIADIDFAAIRRSGRSMSNFYSGDLTDNFVRCRINDADVVSGAVRLDDPSMWRWRRWSLITADPGSQGLPFRIVF